MRRIMMLLTAALITAAMFAVGSPSAFAQAEGETVDCSQDTPEGNARLEGRWVVTPTGETRLVCHGEVSRNRNTEPVTFLADCPTPSGQTNIDSGTGVVYPSGQVRVDCHGTDVGGL
jgi:hypothetical protein